VEMRRNKSTEREKCLCRQYRLNWFNSKSSTAAEWELVYDVPLSRNAPITAMWHKLDGFR
jgi:hypothetical protein